jgi:hypothetical protein
MSTSPGPPPDFIVRDREGRDYPANVGALQQWARDSRITLDHQVYSYASGEWLRASELSALRGLFSTAPPVQTGGGMTCLGIGCVMTLVLVVLLGIVTVITRLKSDEHRSSSDNASVPSPAPQSDPGTSVRTTAADLFSSRFANSTLSGWGIRAHAVGPDCSVLLVTFDVTMEDSMISGLHSGSGLYGSILRGGVAQFYTERSFRGVVYRDANGRTWTYGAVSPGEVSALTPC